MAITVACHLSIHPADITSEYPSSDLSGLVELRIRSRYQLLVQADPENGGLQFPLDEVFTPELCICFAIPTGFLFLEEVTELYVENKLLEFGLDDNGSKFLAPKIAEFASEEAKRRDAGEMEQGYATVAEVWIERADLIHKEELSRIASNLNAECGTCINVDDPDFFFSGISDFMAEHDNSLSLPF